MNGEPWRYICPEGHVTVKRRQNLPLDAVEVCNQDKNPESTLSGGRRPAHRFYCDTCREGYDRVMDKKTGRTVKA